MQLGMRRRGLLSKALLCLLLTSGTRAEEAAPGQVRPSTGTFSGLHRGSMRVARTVGERLDKGHDWLYRRLEKMLVTVDQRYAVPQRAPLLVPLSPLRIDLVTEFLNRQHGLGLAPRVEFDATLRLPNIERRMRIYISSGNLSEAPGNPAIDRNPVRAGVRFVPHSHIDVDFGVRVKFKPVVYAALRWAPQFDVGQARLYPLVKPYLESGLGLGVSSGIALERWHERWVVRSSSFANWRRTTSATSWDQTLLIGHAQSVIQERQYGKFTAGRDLACGTIVRALASGDRLSSASLYEISVLFKRPLHGGWLYGYFEPLVRWERGSDWHPDSGFRIGLDALFWSLAADSATAASVCR
jgi:hypothetical protein